MEGFERCFERDCGDIARCCARRTATAEDEVRFELEVTVTDGLVRRVRAGGEVTEYLSLGEPQSIERP